MHGDDHPTHILLPTLGIAYALLPKEEQVPFAVSPVITNLLFLPIPAILFLPLFIPTSELNILNNPAITPEHQSSALKLQHTMTRHNPIVIL